MIEIDYAIKQKESELEAYLIRLNNPNINQILDDLKSLRRSQEILNQFETPPHNPPPSNQIVHKNEEIVNKNGNNQPPVYATVGDAAAGILKEAGKPLSLDHLYKEIEKLGLHSSRSSFRTLLVKDRRKRFNAVGNGNVSLSETPDTESFEGNNRRRLANLGFSLKDAVKKVLPELKGEFTRPDVSILVQEQNPDVAEMIQKASVSSTLQSLVKDGLLIETYEGHGSDPKRYRVAEKAIAPTPTQNNLLAFTS